MMIKLGGIYGRRTDRDKYLVVVVDPLMIAKLDPRTGRIGSTRCWIGERYFKAEFYEVKEWIGT